MWFLFIGSTSVAEKNCIVTRQDEMAEMLQHTSPIVTASNVMLVTELSTSHSQSVLKNYFNNKRKCGGGDITSVMLKGTQAYVSFVDSNGNGWVCNHVYLRKAFDIIIMLYLTSTLKN